MIKFATALLIGISSTSLAAATVSQGRAAYDLNRVGEAKQIYLAIASEMRQPADERARAHVELARIAWLIEGNADLAVQETRAARATGAEVCEASRLEARILREAGRLPSVIRSAASLTRVCRNARKRDAITTELVKAHLDAAAALPQARSRELAAASRLIASLGLEARESLDVAAATLEIGLLTKSAQTALAGWRDYFWLIDNAGPPALRDLDPEKVFPRALHTSATQRDRVDLAYLLVRAGFAEPAQRFIDVAGVRADPSDAKWRMIDAYLTQRKALTTTILEVNRALARGLSKEDPRLQKAAFQSLGSLMAAAGATGDPRKAVRDNYGLLGSVGLTSGYSSVHIGHVVEERSETVRQYGHEATVRFAAIDNLWANGFESWLWDGAAETGGWSGDGLIVHVRPAYTSAPASAFALVGATSARRELQSKIRAWEAVDLAQARSGTPATFQGLNGRLRLQLVDQIAAKIGKSRRAGTFRRAFLAEYWRANLQQSIFVHEGRHAIDKAMAADASKLDDMTLEYQANLSELALSDYPRMAFYNLNRGIGGSSPHEIASTRLLAQYAKWTRDHSGQVRGFDANLPAEVQIDKLSDGQIRDIARGLDPLAQATASAGSRSGTSTR